MSGVRRRAGRAPHDRRGRGRDDVVGLAFHKLPEERIMLRSMSHAVRVVAIAALGVPAVAAAQTDTRPVVVVFTFDNNSIGPARGDYDGLKTGVQDLLITDLASNAKIRLVDRSRIADLLQEQNLVRAGQ